MTLRLGQLPDRTPVRMSLSVDPDLASALSDYAEIYRQTYGAEEKPEALIPAMIESFLASDAGFKRARRALHSNASNER
ncbi:DUF2274 domain-containing protein [Henriciella mobilis]|jgi:hypothetical protein|uniref:DUF2274 domain-containing protein n=1 Tax=Henriciella mobilis TaxID=2305467 RepID=UPI000E66247D|nr:DUF2274 domain-containing protein [Henriciella mobilis]RIJ16462.1 DUF2274 domain-containing protein [Henriciella mobilis]RIJ22585.1 DUF2274 domain-containing protein [Henriciella mobilis]|tara:strand:+ start:17663 stop:17899 length:237 start_codon:yes stop_codon:yes gene_type:complete